jgi:S1-C subfamily serine protease
MDTGEAGGFMRSRVILAVAAIALLPAAVFAVPRPPEPRLHPRDTGGYPSYVQRVEPSIVGLKVRGRADAASSARLGVHRFATGIVFDSRGYALTVSYVLLDAVEVEAQRRDGQTASAKVMALDLDSGLGVVKLDGDDWTPAKLGDSRDVTEGTLTGTVAVDEDNDLAYVTGSVRSTRRFAASWEYMLSRAFIVTPANTSWGGAALVNDRGEVIGVGSLRLGESPYANLFVPLEHFLPVREELLTTGRVQSRSPRPWLGIYTSDEDKGLTVDGFSPTGPAARAGFKRGDLILGVDGVKVGSQEEFYEALWRHRAGEVIKVSVSRDNRRVVIPVESIDRHPGLDRRP